MKAMLALDTKGLYSYYATLNEQLYQAEAQQMKYKRYIFTLQNELSEISRPKKAQLAQLTQIDELPDDILESQRTAQREYAEMIRRLSGFQALDFEAKLRVLRDLQQYLFDYSVTEKQSLRALFSEAVKATCQSDMERSRFLKVVYNVE